MHEGMLSWKTRRKQYAVVAMLLVAAVVDYMDRASLAVANPLIRHDLGLNVAEMGLLLSMFSWAYAGGRIPAGILIDRIGPRWLLGGAVFLWSVAQAIAGLSTGLATFAWARLGLGVLEAPNGPGGARALSNWFNRRHRGVPVSLVFSGGSLGSLIALPFLTWLMLTWGWRAMFIVMGVLGAIYALIWMTFYRDAEVAGIPARDVAAIAHDDVGGIERVTMRDWGKLLRFRTTWGLIGGMFGRTYLEWLYLTWLPGYLEITHHMSLPRVGLLGAIPPLFAYIGGVSGRSLCDLLAARGVGLVASRRLPCIIGVIGMAAFTLPVVFINNSMLDLTLISTAVFFGGISGVSAWVLVTAVAPQSYIASLGSMMNCGGYIGAALAPAVTGILLQMTGSFAPGLIVGVGVAALSAVSYMAFTRRPIVPQVDRIWPAV